MPKNREIPRWRKVEDEWRDLPGQRPTLPRPALTTEARMLSIRASVVKM